MSKIPAYQILVSFSDELKESSYERHLVSEQYKLNQLRRNKSGVSSVTLDLSFTQMSNGWMEHLSDPTLKFVMRNLVPGLKMYNLLWYWSTPKKSQEKHALKELIDKRILFRTETIGIYIVNPIKVWRGTIFSAVECTKKLLLKEPRPTIEMIHDLKPDGKYQLRTGEDDYRLLNENNITPKLLDL